MQVARFPAGVEYVFNQRPGAGAVTPVKMALREPNHANDLSVAHVGTLVPGEPFAQFRDTGVDPPRLDLPVPAHHPSPRGIARDGLESQGLVAAFQPLLDIASHNMGRPHPRPADRFET